MAQFMYVTRLVRPEMFETGATDAENEAFAGHGAHLQRLTDEGTLILAGRTQYEDARTFGIVVFSAENESEAEKVMHSDPAVSSGMMTAELHPYYVAFWRNPA